MVLDDDRGQTTGQSVTRIYNGMTSPISPLSPLTPKYGSFMSRDSSLTGINEFASSYGTSYIDTVLIDCYTGANDQYLSMPRHTLSSSLPQIPDETENEEMGTSMVVENPENLQVDITRNSASGILKRPETLSIPNSYLANGGDSSRRRTVTFSQQVQIHQRSIQFGEAWGGVVGDGVSLWEVEGTQHLEGDWQRERPNSATRGAELVRNCLFRTNKHRSLVSLSIIKTQLVFE